MDIAHLSNQQINTLWGIAAFLTFATLALSTAAIIGTIQRINAAKRQTQPPTAPDGPTYSATSRGPGTSAAAGEPQPTPGLDVAV